MRRLLSLQRGWAFALFLFLDIVCVGMGMGIPIFCILLGLPVGWYLVRRTGAGPLDMRQMLSQTLRGAALTAACTVLGMAILWGRFVPLLFDPGADLVNLGIPLILYEPWASLAGWLALMIAISPFLQFLMTLFGSHLTMLLRPPRPDHPV